MPSLGTRFIVLKITLHVYLSADIRGLLLLIVGRSGGSSFMIDSRVKSTSSFASSSTWRILKETRPLTYDLPKTRRGGRKEGEKELPRQRKEDGRGGGGCRAAREVGR